MPVALLYRQKKLVRQKNSRQKEKILVSTPLRAGDSHDTLR
jgi:hypothetical protein